MNDYKNILIVRTDRIGDVILTTPAIHALRRHYKTARISVLVTPQTQDLLHGHPDIDEILIDDRTGDHNGTIGFWKLVRELRLRKFDCAILFHTKKRTNALCFFAGIKNRIGYRNEKLGILLTQRLLDQRHLGEKHEVEYCLDVIRAMGVSIQESDRQLYVGVMEPSLKWVQRLRRENKIIDQGDIIAIHPAASDPSKQWPPKRFAALIEGLKERFVHAEFVLIGDAHSRNAAREISAQCLPRVINLTGLTTVSQCVALIKSCKLVISNDSGPVHIAAALDVPVVSIFTRNQPGINCERWHPLGPRSRFVSVDVDPMPDFSKSGEVDPAALEPIDVDAVLDAIDSIFKL